jgi:transposase-like protein
VSADAVVGAGWGQLNPGRPAQRNGYRHRDLDTRVGPIDVAIPRLRSGSLSRVASELDAIVDDFRHRPLDADYVDQKLTAVHDHLDAARADILAFTGFPTEVRTQVGRTTPPVNG